MAINAEYQTYLNSEKWKAKRREVLKRANYLCERCKEAQATQIHHKTYDRIFRERLNDLQAVCGPCHMEIHGIEDAPPKVRLFGGLKRVLVKVIG
jgi:5-methylcytosine-specific restriction endonuclease McrA